MILKIELIRDSHRVRLRLSGEFRSHHLDQVKAEISRGEPTVLLSYVHRWLPARDYRPIASTALPRPPCVHSPARGRRICAFAAFA